MSLVTADFQDLVPLLQKDAVGVLPTDTLYGLVANAASQPAVERVYSLRARDFKKPCIILIADISQLALFKIQPSQKQKELLEKYWPGPVSLIFESKAKGLEYLHRGQESLALRLPQYQKLTKLLLETGPIIAPSANPQGQEPAKNIKEAQKYFGESLDFYLDQGQLQGQASKVISLIDDEEKILRA